MAEMKKVIIDTNIFMALKDRFDVLEELRAALDFSYEPAIIDKTLEELEKISNSALAKKYIKERGIKTIRTHEGYADDLIIQTCEKDPKNHMVFTNDNELKKRLKQKGIQTISIRQRKYIEGL